VHEVEGLVLRMMEGSVCWNMGHSSLVYYHYCCHCLRMVVRRVDILCFDHKDLAWPLLSSVFDVLQKRERTEKGVAELIIISRPVLVYAILV